MINKPTLQITKPKTIQYLQQTKQDPSKVESVNTEGTEEEAQERGGNVVTVRVAEFAIRLGLDDQDFGVVLE
ncbi:hypothetical protein HDU76_002014, partial [Blyttiomyces sp. JEL0837]